MDKRFILIISAIVLLSSCKVYKQYERPAVNVNSVYRDTINNAEPLAVNDTANFGNIPWKEVFTDPMLQELIDSGLKNNTDLQTAVLSVDQAKSMLKSARLSFLPAFSFNGTGTLSSWDGGEISKTYSLPVEASWTVDLFGSLKNAERSQQAVLLQAEDYQQAIRTSLIANIANCYYTLLMLDRQLELTESTVKLTKQTWDMMEIQKKYSGATEAAVQSGRANYFSVLASIPELKRQIRETENSLSLLLGQAPQSIPRGKLDSESLPSGLNTGIAVQLLSNRPDVHAAEMNLSGCYYATNKARAAFYPNITISGSAGWTNNAGSAIINPGKILAAAVGSLSQPIFANGRLKAALKVAEAQQQAAYLKWQYAVLNAGSEVSNALTLYHSSAKKSMLEKEQIESLQKNVDVTQKLFKLGSSTYIEVISAQQSLLGAQLTQISDDFYKMQAVVNLYYALGGGREQ